MTNEIEALYREIAESVVSEIEMKFQELWIYSRIKEGWSSQSYIVKSGDNTYHDIDLYDPSEPIYSLWETSRMRGDNWDEMTFHLTAHGEFEIDFEYDVAEEKLSDTSRLHQWIAKHLGDVEIKYPPPPSFEDD